MPLSASVAAAPSRGPADPCFGCGLIKPHTTCTLSTTLFTTDQLHSNVSNHFIPSSPEVRALARYKVDDGEAKLRMISKALHHLQQHADTITTTVQQLHRKFLMTILALPNDVLLAVFEHLSLESDLGPWTVAAVCKIWREVALSCSALWTRLDLGKQFGFMPENGYGRLRSRLATQLSRAGDHRNLQLSLDSSSPFQTAFANSAALTPVAVFYTYAARCTVLEIHGRTPFNWRARAAALSPTLPPSLFNLFALKTLSIDDVSWLEAPSIISRTSTLTDLTLSSVSFSDTIDMNSLALGHLKCLTLIACSTSKKLLLEFLQPLSKTLHELEFRDTRVDDDEDDHVDSVVHEIVTLHDLRHLSYSFTDPNADSAYYSHTDRPALGNVRAPNLRSLHFSGLSYSEQDAVDNFLHASNGFPSLNELTINRCDVSTNHFIGFLSKIQGALETLSISDFGDRSTIDDVLRGLRWCGDIAPADSDQHAFDDIQHQDQLSGASNCTGRLCPNLRSLRLSQINVGRNTLRAFIRSRAAATWTGTGAQRGRVGQGPDAFLKYVSLDQVDFGLGLVGQGRGGSSALWAEEAKLGVFVVMG